MKRLFLLLIILTILVSLNVYSATIKVSGDNQRGVINAPLKEPLVVKITKSNNDPAVNRKVTFTALTAGDVFQKPVVYTDANGIARSYVTLGSARYAHNFTVEDAWESVEFTAYADIPIHQRMESVTGSQPDIYKKWIGTLEDEDEDIPELIDWSYAGYKQGEPIPNSFNLSTFNVTSYGAIPNDGLSDLTATENAIDAAESAGGGIVFFPAGQFDFFVGDEQGKEIRINDSNIIIKGSGAEGAAYGGTTLFMHKRFSSRDDNGYAWDGAYFRVSKSGLTGSYRNPNMLTPVTDFHARQLMYIDVEDVSVLNNPDFIVVTKNQTGDDIYLNVSRTPEQISGHSDLVNDGYGFYEVHEVESIDTANNRINLKSPLICPLVTSNKITTYNPHQNIGFEDFHLDGNFRSEYRHMNDNGHNGIMIQGAIHSWIRRVRFSNTINQVTFSKAAHCSAISVVTDGNKGHYAANFMQSTYCFIGLLEDYSDIRSTHGISIGGTSSGNVAWKTGGAALNGPDGHRSSARWNLHDNNYTIRHEAQSGANSRRPHHLDGFVLWNCKTDDSGRFDWWTASTWDVRITGGALIGYIQRNAPSPRDVYTESVGSHVNPLSLYAAQLARRGKSTAHLDTMAREHETFFKKTRAGTLPPVFITKYREKRYVTDGSPPGTQVGSPIKAINSADVTMQYSFVDGEDLPFSINRETGQIFVKTTINRSQRTYYYATVRVIDRNRKYDTVQIMIAVSKSRTGFVPLSERTPAVSNEILAYLRLSKNNDALQQSDITAEMMEDIVHLNLINSNITSLDVLTH